MTTIVAAECPPAPNRQWAGLFEARLGDRLLCMSRQPFLTAARVLVSEGHDPDSVLVMRHTGSNADALSAKLGVAARLTVNETKPAFERWKSFSDAPPSSAGTAIKGLSPRPGREAALAKSSPAGPRCARRGSPQLADPITGGPSS
jgi:hypothetical protein